MTHMMETEVSCIHHSLEVDVECLATWLEKFTLIVQSILKVIRSVGYAGLPC